MYFIYSILGVLGFIGFAFTLIWLILKAITKRPKKGVIAIISVVFLAIWLVFSFLAVNTEDWKKRDVEEHMPMEGTVSE